MRKNWLLLILATVMVTFQFDATAQQKRKDKIRNKANDPITKLPFYKKQREADNLFRQGSYFNAAEYYQQLKAEQERNPYITYQLAECHEATRDYVAAAHYFQEAYALAKGIYPFAKLKEGMMLQQQGRYDEAIEACLKFIKDNPKTYKKEKKIAQRIIDGCEMAKVSIKNPEPVTIVNCGPNVNSAYTESAPVALGDTGLLFSTMRQNSEVDMDKRNRDEYVARFMVSRKQYFTPITDTFQWALKFIDGKFNEPGVHTSNGCFSPGGDRFYFTKCKEELGDSGLFVSKCKIYVSVFEKGATDWSKPETLADGINDDDGSSTQPWMARVGKKEVLFFSSNRKLQSRGGYDLWYSIYDPRTKQYRRPQNCGKQVNTERDEITPYYDDRENRLYFASNGHKGFGGFDIYSADGGPSRYTNMANLGFPINTPADELYFVKDPVGKPDAYVVSNRVGSIALKNPTCCDDIWRVLYEPKLVVIGKVLNRKTQELVPSTAVKMTDQNSELKIFNSTEGAFMFNMTRGNTYVITADKEGYSSTRATVSTMDVKRQDPGDTVTVVIYLDTISNSFMVSNVFYDYDKADLRPESIASMDSLVNFMKDNPSLSVEIYSFADAKGTDDYNINLSKRRAQAVVNYLESAGIEKERMIAKGYGEKNPAAPNTVKGKDNPEGRQLNRRTEFRVVSDVPTRRVVYDSAKPGNMDEQAANLSVTPDESDDDGSPDNTKPGAQLNP
ncbi:MAG: OmpA family protein [Flavipsychrobacter sp.]|nr:OmpA family protein [Flavipsychrobacter sp.]